MPRSSAPPASSSRKGSTPNAPANDGLKAAGRNTDSGPSTAPPHAGGDLALQKAIETSDLATAFPFNATKAGEHGFDQGVSPQAGSTATPPSRVALGSILSERQTNDQVGTQAAEGRNAAISPLDRVRVDS